MPSICQIFGEYSDCFRDIFTQKVKLRNLSILHKNMQIYNFLIKIACILE